MAARLRPSSRRAWTRAGGGLLALVTVALWTGGMCRIIVTSFKRAGAAPACVMEMGKFLMSFTNLDDISITAKMSLSLAFDVQNTFTAKITNAVAGNAAVYTAMGNWLETIYSAFVVDQSDSISYVSYVVNNLANGEISGELSWPTLTVGGAALQQTAPGVCVLALQRTGVSRHTGRKYFGIFTENDMLNGRWGTALLAKVLTAIENASTTYVDPNGVGILPGVLDRAAGIQRGITDTVVIAEPAYQRRRRRGTGS